MVDDVVVVAKDELCMFRGLNGQEQGRYKVTPYFLNGWTDFDKITGMYSIRD